MRMRILLFTAAAAAAATLAAGASAYPYLAGAPVTASGANPFASCPFGALGDQVNYPNSEVEPFVAVNPRNPANLVGVFQQDRWSGAGAHAVVAAYSTDGGASWTESWAATSKCQSASSPFERSTDPWVTFDPNGNAYQSWLGLSADETTTGVQVSKSTNGGATWSSPATIILDAPAMGIPSNDKDSITADPTRPGYVYVVWDRITPPGANRALPSYFGTHAYRGYPMISRTTNGGATWSAPAFMTNANILAVGNQIAVLPSGDLVDIAAVFRGSGEQPSPNAAYEGVFLSSDAGARWRGPIKIANYFFAPLVDPDNGRPVRADDNLPDIAVDRTTGTLYAVWSDGGFSGGDHVDVVLSRSTDGGRNWSEPVKVNQTPGGAAAFNASVEVAADGTVQVAYYDFRNNTSAAGLPTDIWLAHSHTGGVTWGLETHLAGPFDMELAPFSRGYFLGDYQGLAAIGNDALVFDAVTVSATNPSNILSVRAHPVLP
jgi:hypothetical protein